MAAPDTEALVELRNLTFGYGERAILDGVSLTVPRGKVTALMGASGGGKTTVLRLLMHKCLKPDGQVFLQSDQRDYWDYICGIMGRVFEWHEVQGRWPEDEHGRSRREVLSIEQGLPIFRGIGKKRSELTDQELQTLISDLPQPKFRVDGAGESGGHKRSQWKPMRRDRNRR